MTITELLTSIDLSNNGYLFAPTAVELQCARDNPDVVNLRFGRISRTGAAPLACYWSFYPPVARAHSVACDSPDWEGAILARQESAGIYD